MNLLESYRLWCERATLDTDVAEELRQIADEPAQIEDRFKRFDGARGAEHALGALARKL